MSRCLSFEPISKQFQNNSRVENWKYSIDFHRIIIIVRQREKFLHIDKDMERLTVVSKTVVARLSNEAIYPRDFHSKEWIGNAHRGVNVHIREIDYQFRLWLGRDTERE